MSSGSLDEGRQPLEAVCVADALDDRAHENFDGAGSGVFLVCVFAVGGVVVQPQDFSQFLLLERLLLVDFVSEDHEGHILQLRHLQQRVQLLLGFGQTALVGRIHQEDDAVYGAAVVAPGLARLEVAAQVVGIEVDVADGHLGLMRVDGAVCLREPVRLKHVEQRGLPRVVEAQKDDVCALLEEPCPRKQTLEKIHHKHF